MDTKIPQSLPLRGSEYLTDEQRSHRVEGTAKWLQDLCRGHRGHPKLRPNGRSSAGHPSEEALRQWERRMRRVARRREQVEGAVRRSEQRIDELWRKMTDDD